MYVCQIYWLIYRHILHVWELVRGYLCDGIIHVAYVFHVAYAPSYILSTLSLPTIIHILHLLSPPRQYHLHHLSRLALCPLSLLTISIHILDLAFSPHQYRPISIISLTTSKLIPPVSHHLHHLSRYPTTCITSLASGCVYGGAPPLAQWLPAGLGFIRFY